jgi:hypothetical protein
LVVRFIQTRGDGARHVDWATAYTNGARFAHVKATEGGTYTNPYFAQQYNGSYNAGWDYRTFWQNADSGTFPGDQDQFNGD